MHSMQFWTLPSRRLPPHTATSHTHVLTGKKLCFRCFRASHICLPFWNIQQIAYDISMSWDWFRRSYHIVVWKTARSLPLEWCFSLSTKWRRWSQFYHLGTECHVWPLWVAGRKTTREIFHNHRHQDVHTAQIERQRKTPFLEQKTQIKISMNAKINIDQFMILK